MAAAVLCVFPARAQEIPKPVIPPATFNITNYGAVGDGAAMNTSAIQKTVDAASAAGGGTVLVPTGRFLTGPFKLAGKINLHLDKGAVILIDNDIQRYPSENGRALDSISTSRAEDVEISGEGTIDGQGEPWWTAYRANPNITHRPYMVVLNDCTRVWVHGITLTNSPMFHLVPRNCTDVTIENIRIGSPANSPNTDGIDPSGWNYLIQNCTIDTGDDNIAIKPARGGRTPGNKNFVVRNCSFLRGHGMSVGSGTTAGLDGLTVSNCTFDGTDAGVRIKTGRGTGGLLQNALYENLSMNAVKNPIYIIDYYPERNAPKDPSTEKPEAVTERTPIDRNITIRNVTATKCPNAGTIRGLPEMPVSDMVLSNVHISAGTGLKIYHARNIRFENSSVTVEKGESLITFNAEVTGLK